MAATITRFMCPTDDRATSDFKSVWRRHSIAVARMPKMEIRRRSIKESRQVGERRGERRSIPYPPSLSRVPARTMEPAMGASTWALGSHRWREYRGSFTRKAKLQRNQNRAGWLNCWGRNIRGIRVENKDP